MACALYAYETFKDIAQVDDFGPGPSCTMRGCGFRNGHSFA